MTSWKKEPGKEEVRQLDTLFMSDPGSILRVNVNEVAKSVSAKLGELLLISGSN